MSVDHVGRQPERHAELADRTRIALISRDGPVSATRWFDAPPCYVFHPMNHFEDAAGRIVIDAMKCDVAPLFPLPDSSPSTASAPPARLFRWTIDPRADTVAIHERQLDERPGEFPSFDERFAIADYRHGVYVSGTVGAQRDSGGRSDRLVQHDSATGRAQQWTPPPGDRCGEPVFVPRTTDAAEGDSWLLCTIFRGAENRSDLAMFEATGIEQGPVALAHLSSRVPAAA
jgi:carotenoid cleavage dioxygenase